MLLDYAQEGLLVYLEVCESGAYDACRMFHGLRYAGWFEHANAVLVGRTPAPDTEDLTQLHAVDDPPGQLGIPPVAGFVTKWYLALGTIDIHNGILLTVLIVSSFLNAGYFADRWVKVCKAYGIEAVSLDTPWGQPVDPAAVQTALAAHPV